MSTSKVLTDLYTIKQRGKIKKHFWRYCLQSFSSEKEVCVKINGKQTVKLRSGSKKSKNYFNELAVPFKIYADFECKVKTVKSSNRGDRDDNSSYTEKYCKLIPCSFAYKVVCPDDKLTKLVFIYRGKNAIKKFIEAILEEYEYCREVIKKHFNKNLIISKKDENFRSNNKCWICDKLFDVGDDKVTDHCHITGKHRVSAHWSCNTNLRLTKKVPVIFHKLRD